MSDTNTTAKRPVSDKQLAANRLNSKRSTGPSEEGRKRSCKNNLQHGLFSTQAVLPSECPVERQKLADSIRAAAQPGDGVQELLTERIIDTAWLVRRGQRAQEARAAKKINALVEGSGDEEARRVETLAAVLDESRDAFRQLRTFPSGVAYLREQWSILLEGLSLGVPLLATQRRRCLSLIGKTREDVLRSDRQATKWLLPLIGLMYGRETTLDDVQSLLGTKPPEWMQQAEFVNRARRLLKAVPTKAEAREQLEGYIAEMIDELDAQAEFINEVAERDLQLDAAVACMDATPEGTKLANQVDKLDRGCMAAIRRLESRQKPDRRAPKRDAKKAETAAAAVGDLGARDQAAPADVAADVQDSVAADVPTDAPAPAAATTAETDEPKSVVEPDRAAPAEPGAENYRVEAILEPAPAERGAENYRVEAILEPAPAERGAENFPVEAIVGDGAKGDEFDRFGPYAAYLRDVRLHFQATYGAGEPGDGPGPGPASPSGPPPGTSSGIEPVAEPRPGVHRECTRTDTPLSRAKEQFTRTQEELSRQLDAHFGINGDRPDPGRPPPVSDGPADRLDPGEAVIDKK